MDILSSLSLRYKSVVECERVTVWTFEGLESVSSFRSVVPSQEYLQLMETVLSSEQTYTPWTVGEQRTRRVRPMGGEEGGGGASEVESSPQGQAAPEQLSKNEARRLKKEQRKREVYRLCYQLAFTILCTEYIPYFLPLPSGSGRSCTAAVQTRSMRHQRMWRRSARPGSSWDTTI